MVASRGGAPMSGLKDIAAPNDAGTDRQAIGEVFVIARPVAPGVKIRDHLARRTLRRTSAVACGGGRHVYAEASGVTKPRQRLCYGQLPRFTRH